MRSAFFVVGSVGLGRSGSLSRCAAEPMRRLVSAERSTHTHSPHMATQYGNVPAIFWPATEADVVRLVLTQTPPALRRRLHQHIEVDADTLTALDADFTNIEVDADAASAPRQPPSLRGRRRQRSNPVRRRRQETHLTPQHLGVTWVVWSSWFSSLRFVRVCVIPLEAVNHRSFCVDRDR